MKFKSGKYTGEKFTDGSLRIYRNGKIVCEFYVSVSTDAVRFGKKEFDSLCRSIEKNCHPYARGANNEAETD